MTGNHGPKCCRIIIFTVLRLLLIGGSLLAAASAPVGEDDKTAITTLREYMMPTNNAGDDTLVYLAMGPAFFGFYGYFGALAGLEDALFGSTDKSRSLLVEHNVFSGVSGASAGAMAAILLAAGISPHTASTFVSSLGLTDFADPGGLGAILRGDRFESIMADFLREASPIASSSSSNPTFPLDLEEALIPVAVSAVNIQPQIPNDPSWWQSWMAAPWSYITSIYMPTAKILTQGSMARAARASACFPGLFQPVGWVDRGGETAIENKETSNSGISTPKNSSSVATTHTYSLLIDGGILDWAGYNGLQEIVHKDLKARSNYTSANEDEPRIKIINMVVGGFGTTPPGPKAIAKSLNIQESQLDSVFSLSIHGLPNCGPLTMKNGPIASQAARTAIHDAVDRPIGSLSERGEKLSSHHYVLEIDASAFVENGEWQD